MSRRREVYAERGPQPPPAAPISIIWAEPPKMVPGTCPKCGEHIGRAMRVHAGTCQGKEAT